MGRVAATESLPPSCPVKISASVTGAAVAAVLAWSVIGVPVVVSGVRPSAIAELAGWICVTELLLGLRAGDHWRRAKAHPAPMELVLRTAAQRGSAGLSA